MNTGCFKCDKAQWDADGCTCKITGLLVGNAERGCEYRKGIELKPCPFCGGKAANCTKQYDGRIYRYRIQCDNAACSCRTPWLYYQEDAADVWNRRDGVDEKKLSCHFEHCKEALELIQDYKAENIAQKKLIAECKRLLKSAFDEWHIVCEWGECSERCDWFENGKCTQEWSGKAEALKLIGDEPNGI